MALSFVGASADMTVSPKGQHSKQPYGIDQSGPDPLSFTDPIIASLKWMYSGSPTYTATMHGFFAVKLIDASNNVIKDVKLKNVTAAPDIKVTLGLNSTEGVVSETLTANTYELTYNVSEVNFGEAGGSQKSRIELDFGGLWSPGANNDSIKLCIFNLSGGDIIQGCANPSGGGMTSLSWDFDVTGP